MALMSTNFLTYSLPQHFLENIREHSDKKPILNNSHRGKMANYIGNLGMYSFEKWIERLSSNQRILDLGITNVTAEIVDVVNYDVLVSLNFRDQKYSYKIEVKTKDRNVYPKSNYEVSVPCNTYKYQIPDYYFALSLERSNKYIKDSFKNIHFLGFISRSNYDIKKYLEKAGEKDNGANFFCDTWNIKIADLIDPAEFPKGLFSNIIA